MKKNIKQIKSIGSVTRARDIVLYELLGRDSPKR